MSSFCKNGIVLWLVRNGYDEEHLTTLGRVCVRRGLVYYTKVKTSLAKMLQETMTVGDWKVRKMVLHKIILVRNALLAAAGKFPMEGEELNDEAAKWEHLIANIFQLPSFDIAENLETALEIDANQSIDKHERTVNMFQDEAFLGKCVVFNLKAPFGSVSISSRIRQAFWGATTPTADRQFVDGPTIRYLEKNGLFYFQGGIMILDSFHEVMDMCWNPRSCPAVIFFLEGLSKIVIVILSSHIAVQSYGYQGDFHFLPVDMPTFGVTIVLLVMIAATIMYEVGQLAERGSMNVYITNPWNFLDFCAIMLLLVWAILLHSPEQQVARQIVLALSMIPMSLTILQYLSYFKSLGHCDDARCRLFSVHLYDIHARLRALFVGFVSTHGH